MLDLRITNASIVDGTGVPRAPGEVAVRDGRIVVADHAEAARRTIDADGRVVAPGWIDVHTHYDTQVFWDPLLAPAPLHGTTTVITGQCSFSVAPARAEDADYVLRMFARAEGLPYELLATCIEWEWRDAREMVEQLTHRGVGLNVGMLVGHSSLRRAVMGERAVGEAATTSDVEAMRALLAATLQAGFVGLSTTFDPLHRDGDLEHVPAFWASREERVALAQVVGSAPGTTLQSATGSIFSDEIRDVLIEMSLAADRPLNWGGMEPGVGDPEKYRVVMAGATHAADRGAYMRPLVRPEKFPYVLTLASGFMFDTIPGWLELFQRSIPDRIQSLRDPAVRAQLRADAERTPEWSAVSEIRRWSDHVVLETVSEQNRGIAGRTIGDIAQERGADPFDTLLDISIADDLRTVALAPSSRDDDDTWALRSRLAADPSFMVGGSDGGAHMDMHCGAAFMTGMFSEFRRRELLPVEQLVRLVTSVPARHFGLHDRGRIAPGCRADLVVFDPDTIGPGPMMISRDLPTGAPCIVQRATGIEHVLVNGTPVTEHGEITGERPGTILRSGHDTKTVTNRDALAWAAAV